MCTTLAPIFLVICLVLLITTSLFSTSNWAIKANFQAPFADDIEYVVTSEYGERIDPITGEKAFHDGIDLSASEGTDILASYSGFVIETGYQEEGLGNYIIIEHTIEGQIYRSTYGHLLDDSIIVSEGQRVDKNEKIATIGSTGKSTGTHVHFMISEVKNNLEETINVIFLFEED